MNISGCSFLVKDSRHQVPSRPCTQSVSTTHPIEGGETHVGYAPYISERGDLLVETGDNDEHINHPQQAPVSRIIDRGRRGPKNRANTIQSLISGFVADHHLALGLGLGMHTLRGCWFLVPCDPLVPSAKHHRNFS